MSRHHGSGSVAWPLRLSGCFCCANNSCKKRDCVRVMRHVFRLGFVSCLLGLLVTTRPAGGQTAVTSNVKVEAEELPSAYGAPPDLSRGRISTLTKSYVLPPFSFALETIYEGDLFRHGPPRHLFTQEVEMGLPLRFYAAMQNQLQRLSGRANDRICLAGRYALA